MKKIFFVFVLCAITFGYHFHVVVAEEEILPPPDTNPPVITLVGDSAVSIPQGETYLDAGATALDDIDGDVTATIIVTNPVDTETPGDYTVSYAVSDAAGNSATPVERTVTVIPLPPPPEPEPTPTETVLIRSGDTILYQGTVDLPLPGTIDITDNIGEIHAVDTDSALGLLYAIDQTSDAFSLSDIQYYSSFNSLYLKCITPASGDPLCDNWQYVVDTVTPWSAVDATILSGGEHVGFYFGTSHQVIFDETSVIENESFTATAQKYNYEDNTWSPLTGATIGATVPNPDDPWNPTVVATQAVDADGRATLTLTTTGTYTIGISEDYYFPSYTVEVVRRSQGGGGGGVPPPPPVFSIPNAIAYLSSVQNADGSFGGSDMYTDWAGIAFGAIDVSDMMRTKIIEYMQFHNTVSNFVTDNERRAMSLLALGENPYSFYGTDYVTPIIDSFDGTQFGDALLVNDDIFALIPLSHVGYTIHDEMIAIDISFILSKQRDDGSWEGSTDLSAAAIQALAQYSLDTTVSNALSRAGEYIAREQSYDGGWGSVYATNWAMQAEKNLHTSWIKGNYSGQDYLANRQSSDGGLLSLDESLQNRIWATSYAIPAILGKPWDVILHSVPKPDRPAINDVVSQNQNNEELVLSSNTDVSKPLSTVDPSEHPIGIAHNDTIINNPTVEQTIFVAPDAVSHEALVASVVESGATRIPLRIPFVIAGLLGVAGIMYVRYWGK